MSQSPIDEVGKQQLAETTMAIYAAITLLGVIAAASWKGLFVDELELIVIIIATTVTVAVAHTWASAAAHRVVTSTPLSREEWREEVRLALSVFVVGGLAIAAFFFAQLIGFELAGAVTTTLLMLVAVLFVVGVVGGRRERRTWPRSLGIGLLDASIGIVVLLVKITLGA
jgi:peptidoglycan/LPS O-acetylase OafA/YrhL